MDCVAFGVGSLFFEILDTTLADDSVTGLLPPEEYGSRVKLALEKIPLSTT